MNTERSKQHYISKKQNKKRILLLNSSLPSFNNTIHCNPYQSKLLFTDELGPAEQEHRGNELMTPDDLPSSIRSTFNFTAVSNVPDDAALHLASSIAVEGIEWHISLDTSDSGIAPPSSPLSSSGVCESRKPFPSLLHCHPQDLHTGRLPALLRGTCRGVASANRPCVRG